jgi:arsenate reductase (thioredoxin)
MNSARPSVLFVRVHNAVRSQTAAAFLTHLAGDRIEVRSAGSAPADTVNPAVAEAMREVGIDICAETPKTLTVDAVRPIRDAIEKRVRDLIADVTRD